MRLKSLAVVLGVLYLTGCASTGRLKVGQAPGGEVVEADGSCPIVSNDVRGAKECSLREAQKRALEKVIGVFISAKTRVEKAVTIEQNILANTQGYISKYDILHEGREGDYFKTKIRALVLFQKLGDDLKEMDVLREPSIGLPRVAAIVADGVDKAEKSSSDNEVMTTYAANALSRALLQAGYKVIDPEALVMAKAYETMDEAQTNPETLKALGTKLEAEIIVYGDAKTSPVVMDNSILGGMKSYRATLSAKAARVQTGEVLSVLSSQASGLDATESAAIQKALEAVGQKAGQELSQSLREALSRQSSVQLTATHIADFGSLEQLKKAIQDQPGIKDLFLRSFEEGIAKLDIYLESLGKIGVQDIGQALTQKLAAKVTRVDGNALEVALP